MSAVVKLSSKLPGDAETNGLDAHAGRLLDDPAEPILAIVWIDNGRTIHDTDSDAHIPTARIRRIEVIADDVNSTPPEVVDLVAQAMQRRTGRRAIPFAMVEVSEGYDPAQLSIVDDEDEDGEG